MSSGISNIGGAVLRSKTADFEQILLKQTGSKSRKTSQTGLGLDKPKRKTSAEPTRHPMRMEPDPNVGERLAGGSSYRSPSPSRNVWRRKDVISSMPKHKKPYTWFPTRPKQVFYLFVQTINDCSSWWQMYIFLWISCKEINENANTCNAQCVTWQQIDSPYCCKFLFGAY